MRILLAALAWSLASCSQPTSAPPASEPLWKATLYDLDDRPVALAKYRGQPLVVNFWARWCPPCRDEIPDFVRARAQFKAQGAEVLGIAIEDQAGPVKDFAREYAIDYPALLAKEPGYDLMRALGNTQEALPFTVVIDREGQLVARKVGRMSKSEIEAALTAAIH
jgi:peroxiredoxin